MSRKQSLSIGLFIALGGAVFYALVRLALFGSLNLSQVLGPLVFILIVSTVGLFARPYHDRKHVLFTDGTILLVAITVVITGVYAMFPNTAAAWALAFVACGSAASLFLAFFPERNRLLQFFMTVLLAVGVAAIPVMVEQVEDRFSREEFFAAVDAVFLVLPGLIIGLILVSWRNLYVPETGRFRLRTPVVTVFIVLFVTGLSLFFVRAYQTSFFPQFAMDPGFGISEEEPYLCETLQPSGELYTSEEVKERLVQILAEKPNKIAPDYAFLGLVTAEKDWLDAYREAFLQEVAGGMFTLPANSIKYDQYLAGQRIYFYLEVVRRYPELFSQGEQARVSDWIAAVNARALAPGWVDLLYSISFSKLPDGPYENQENGLGLLSLIQANGLVTGELSAKNAAYLEDHLSGWQARFRNSDDAVNYQPEWIENAWHQSFIMASYNFGNVELAFEWLLLQTPPSGAPLQYNHLGIFTMASLGSLAYSLTGDPSYIWLIGRAGDYLLENGRSFSARPGMELAVNGEGAAPDEGSCLLYGNSGLPNQAGPLLPDKLVFRDGWEEDDKFLLLNLRFTGWHRYKASNSVISLQKGAPIVVEDNHGEIFRWLPAGRSLFRDKRIPRENLNGLVVPKFGMDRVVHTLVGSDSSWAQNVPFTAEVREVDFGEEFDRAVIVLPDWNGWTHERTIWFYHDGPILFFDQVVGPVDNRAGITWHFSGARQVGDERFRINNTDWGDVEIIMVHSGEAETVRDEDSDLMNILLLNEGAFEAVTVFLFDRWLGSSLVFDEDGRTILIQSGSDQIQIDAPAAINSAQD